MPSPIAHLGAGYVVYQLSERFAPKLARQPVGPLDAGLVVALAASLAPDSDSALGIMTGQFGRYHNNLTHSFFVAALAALGFGSALGWRSRRGFRYWIGLIFTSYGLHVAMDSAAVSRGVMAFWPLTSDRFLFPISIFYGLHWSEGLFSYKHVITIVTELGFVAVILALSRFAMRRLQSKER